MQPSCALLLALVALGACSWADATPRVVKMGIDPNNRPHNIAVFAGESIVFKCWKDPFSVENPRIQWWEFAYRADGQLISDDIFLLPSHPQFSRYRLVYDEDAVNQRDLHILNVTLADAGTYACLDGVASVVELGRATAELVVMAEPQRCTSTLPDENSNLATIETQSLTAECIINYRGNLVPHMRWYGPPPFAQIQSSTSTASYSAMQAYADRTMHQQHWESVVNFTVPTLLDEAATNPPDHEHSSTTPRISVHWVPVITHVIGLKPLNEYYAGDVLEANIDAFPEAAAEWTNQRTGQTTSGSIFTVPESWVGESQTMRCQATNIINNIPYSHDFFIQVNAIPPPTTPTTTQPTTTTPPPAVADCGILTGRWESTNPLNAYMCVEVDTTGESLFGNLHAVLRNGTETFWVDLIGSHDLSDGSHASFTGIWPFNRYVSAFIGECSRCHGVDILLVTAISRSKGGPQCAVPGEILYSQEFEFRRNPNVLCPPITVPSPI